MIDLIVRRIYIMLGSACNMKCNHCSQWKYKDTNEVACAKELTPEVVNFIKESSSNVKTFTIYFWGGEPLVYWDTITKMVKQIVDAGVKNYNFVITTNGLLLSRTITDFCLKYNFYIILSHDAPNPTLYRGSIPNDEALDVFREYKGRKAIVSSYCAGNSDIVEANRIIESKFPNIRHSWGSFMTLDDIAKSTSTFSDGEIERTLTDYYNTTGKILFKNRWIPRADKFDNLMYRWIQSPICGHGFNTWAIDYKGDVYLCHNVGTIVGNISEGKSEINRKSLALWLKQRPPNCLTCDVKEYCQCHCGHELLTEDGKEYYSCKATRELIKTILKLDKENKNGKP